MAEWKLPQDWNVFEDYAYMYFIRRNGERVKIIASPDDVCWLKLFRWAIDGKGRAFTYWLTGKYFAMHRMIINVRGSEQVDHINNNPLDNRKENLRICSHLQNQRNKLPQKGRSCKYKGVSTEKRLPGRFRAKISVNGKSKCLGRYNSAEEAALIYDEAAIEYYGDFARTNASLGLI